MAYVEELKAAHVERQQRFYPAGLGPRYSPPVVAVTRAKCMLVHPSAPNKARPRDLVDRFAVEKIVQAVATAHGITVPELRAKGRSLSRDMARPHLVATLAALRPDLSLTEIATAIRRKDHTTICHHLSRWAEVERYCSVQITKVTELLNL